MNTASASPSASSSLAQRTARADYYSLLEMMLQFPTPELSQGVLDGSAARDFAAILEETGIEGEAGYDALLSCAAPDQTNVAEEDAKAHHEALRREYTRLFNHPEHPVIPFYEGVFIDHELAARGKPTTGARVFINPAALNAERCYRNAGMRKTSEKNFPADCITTELAFLGYLHEQAARALRDEDAAALEAAEASLAEFHRIHSKKWILRFFERCAEESRHALYAAAGIMGVALMKSELADGAQTA